MIIRENHPLLIAFPLLLATATSSHVINHHRLTQDTRTTDGCKSTNSKVTIPRNKEKPKIAIIGGGIAGVTAAASIASRFPSITITSPLEKLALTISSLSSISKTSLLDVDITIYEADSNHNNSQWKAATYLNAQSMVPSVSMHCFSQPSTLHKILKDWVRYMILYNTNPSHSIPPNVIFSFSGCLGLSCTWSERISFLSFLYHFLFTSLTTSSKSVKERGSLLYQLSKANQMLFMQRIQAYPNLASKIGLQSGFLSLHRSENEALSVIQEAKEYEFEAQVLSMDQLKDIAPTLAALPIPNPIFAVLRKGDSTSHCAFFIQNMMEQLVSMGVQHHVGRVNSIQYSSSNERTGKRFQVQTVDGMIQDYDYLVLQSKWFCIVKT